MFVGHYGVSFVAKAHRREIPLWLLFIAVQLIDVFWAIFVLSGIEKVRIVPGYTASSPLDLYYMPYTHSLLGAALWSIAFGVICVFIYRWNRAAGVIAGLAVFSHWVLDLLVHRPDLALYDSHMKMGLGLWNYKWPEFILEALFLFIGIYTLYAVHAREWKYWTVWLHRVRNRNARDTGVAVLHASTVVGQYGRDFGAICLRTLCRDRRMARA